MQLYLAIVGSKFFTIQFYSVSIPKLIIHNAERILFWRHYINSYTTTGSVKVSKCLILTAVKIWSDWRISLLWHTVYSHILPWVRVTFHIGLRCVEESQTSGKNSNPTFSYTVTPCFTDILLLRTVCFVPAGKRPFIYSNFSRLNTDTFCGPLSVRIEEV